MFPIDTLLQMDRLPQGQAEVCRLCGFLLEIILPLVSLRFLPINNRSSVAIQSSVSKPFLSVMTHSTIKRGKGAKECKKQPHCMSTDDCNHFEHLTRKKLSSVTVAVVKRTEEEASENGHKVVLIVELKPEIFNQNHIETVIMNNVS